MNSINLTGRLVRDPEIRYTGEQKAVAKFTLAVQRDKDTADYPSVICFGKTAEMVEKWLTKGKQIGVQGRIQTGKYEKDGKTVYTTDVIADRIEFLGGKEETEKKPKQEQIPEGFGALDEDSIPF